jgi:hypothetical protein
MPVKYTHRKGTTYTLCQGVTKIGKPRCKRDLHSRSMREPARCGMMGTSRAVRQAV